MGQSAEWHPSQRTVLGIQGNQVRLAEQFQHYLNLYDRSFLEGRTFGGPSLYFHFRCIARFAGWPVRRKLADECFAEYLYAILASWGMHRMGDTAAKLRPFQEFRVNILAQADRLSELEQYTILTLSERDLDAVLDLLDDVLGELVVSMSGAQLVAATKVLHHIIPDLLPPMDRRYTLAFFGINPIRPVALLCAIDVPSSVSGVRRSRARAFGTHSCEGQPRGRKLAHLLHQGHRQRHSWLLRGRAAGLVGRLKAFRQPAHGPR